MKKDKTSPRQTENHETVEGGTGKSSQLPHIARGAIINFSGIIARMVLVYGFTFMLARTLSADELGQYFIVLTVVNLLGAAAVVGLDMGVVRFVSIYAGIRDYRLAGKSMWVAIRIGVPVGLVFATGLFFAAPKVSNMFLEGSSNAVTALRILGVAIPFLVAARLFNSTTQGMHQMRYQVYSRDLGEQTVKLTLSGAALALGGGLYGVVYANVASVVFAAAVSMLFAVLVLSRAAGRAAVAGPGEKGEPVGRGQADKQHPAGRPEKPLPASPAKALIWYSVPLAFANILVALWLQTDKLLLGYLGTTASVAFYGVAISLSVYSSKIITAFATVFSPIISDLWHSRQKEKLDALFKTVTRWIFTITLPVFLVLVIFAEPVMRLFGPDFNAAAGALILLAFGQLWNAGTGVCGMMVIMSGHSKLELLNVIVTLIIDVALCFLLIPAHGLLGAAIANMVCLIVVNLMRVAEVWIFMRIQAYDRSYFKPVIAGVVVAAAMILINRFLITAGGFKQLVFNAALLLLLYFLVMLLLGLDERDKDLLRQIKGRMA